MRLKYAIALCVIAGFLLHGCARRRSSLDREAPPPPPITLEVINNNWSDMVVYVIRGGQRVRVLTVVSTMAENILLPRDLVGPGGEVRVFAHSIGGTARYLSPTVYASPGTTVAVNLEIVLNHSTVVVR